MPSRSRLSLSVIASATLLAAIPATAAMRSEHTFKLTLKEQTVKTSTGLTLTTDRDYTAPAAGTKPLLVTKVTFALPAGSKINTAAATRCSISVLRTQGAAGCRSGTSVGGGDAVAITGTALDPVKEKVDVFVTKTNGMAAILTGLQTVVIPLAVQGNKLAAALPRLCLPPGTPANNCAAGEIVLKTLKITLKAKTTGSGAKAKRLVTTPPSCVGGKWKSRATYRFANGDTDVQSSTTTCRR
jgi:hypothetical protein